MISSRGNKILQEYYMYICILGGPTKQYLQSHSNVSGECLPTQNYDADT